MILVRHLQHPWIVIAETGADAKLFDGDRLRGVQMTEQSLQVTYGIEITAPQAVPLERLNRLLADLGEAPLAEQEYNPVRAA
jgi:hypothetical protein